MPGPHLFVVLLVVLLAVLLVVLRDVDFEGTRTVALQGLAIAHLVLRRARSRRQRRHTQMPAHLAGLGSLAVAHLGAELDVGRVALVVAQLRTRLAWLGLT